MVGKKWKDKNIMLWRERMKLDEPYADKSQQAWIIPATMRFVAKPIDYLSIQSSRGA